MSENVFDRTGLLFGPDKLAALGRAGVAIFGVGGVGGWCAESLVRSGIGRIMLVDFDSVCVSNVNRQVAATLSAVGKPKVEVLAARFRDINPACRIETRCGAFNAGTADAFDLSGWDFVVDAIDSVPDKALLVRRALAEPSVTLFSSMGAARKTDPFQIRATPFLKVEGDGLARALRNTFRKTGGIPQKTWTCVWSPERRENLGVPRQGERANGTVAHLVASFGFALASLVVNSI